MILKQKKVSFRSPKHLSESSRRWWLEVVSQFELEEHHRKLLTGACEALDRATEAREAVAKDGAYLKNRFGEITKHPGIAVERDALVVFARLLRELDLDIDPPAEASRPPALRSMRGGRNAG